MSRYHDITPGNDRSKELRYRALGLIRLSAVAMLAATAVGCTGSKPDHPGPSVLSQRPSTRSPQPSASIITSAAPSATDMQLARAAILKLTDIGSGYKETPAPRKKAATVDDEGMNRRPTFRFPSSCRGAVADARPGNSWLAGRERVIPRKITPRTNPIPSHSVAFDVLALLRLIDFSPSCLLAGRRRGWGYQKHICPSSPKHSTRAPAARRLDGEERPAGEPGVFTCGAPSRRTRKPTRGGARR